MFLLILEREEERERDRDRERGRQRGGKSERNINQLPPVHSLTGNQTCNLLEHR